MDVLINQFKDSFDTPWHYHLCRRHNFGSYSVMWRRKGVNGKGQSTVKFDDRDFSLHRRQYSYFTQELFYELEMRRLNLNAEFSIAMHTLKTLNLRNSRRLAAKQSTEHLIKKN